MTVPDHYMAQVERLAQKDDAVRALLNAYRELSSRPDVQFYESSTRLIAAMSKEMDGISESESVITADDNTFERVHKLLKDSKLIFDGLEKGRSMIFGSSAEPETKEGKKKFVMGGSDGDH